MDAEHKDERTIFKAALKIKSPTGRAAYLKGACENDAELLARVEALLESHDEAGSFLEGSVLGPHAEPEKSRSIDGPGTRIGHYELLELIGEGGVRHRLEGMMAKRLDSPYLIGKRSSDWLKIKVAHTADFEVIGCVPMRGEKAVRALGFLPR